ncbi:MAG: PP0621 family protein [Gammaproteobacteria bacterium]|jgi:uncharacterized protein
MGLIRLLIYIFLIWLAISFFKRLLHSPSPSHTKKKPRQIESFVACHKCGLHIPQEEAIEHEGQYYCCKAHRDA